MGLTGIDRADVTEPVGSEKARAEPSHGHDIVVLGASAGGVEALSELVECLPVELPAAVFVVLHLFSGGPSLLPAILNRAGALPAVTPGDGDPIEHGRIYVAPPDAHLLVSPGHAHLWRGPPEHSSRPAIDPLFRTAAGSYGPRVVGVVLSGTLDDGVAGLAVIKRRGGVGLVQSPDEALFQSMPRSAIATLDVDAVLPVRALATELERLAHAPVPSAEQFVPISPAELDEAAAGPAAADAADGPGLDLLCPECGRPLTEMVDGGDGAEFACDQGHAFSAPSLIARQGDGLESALWEAVRKLEQRATLLAGLAGRARALGARASAERFEGQARDNMTRVRSVRRALLASAAEDIADMDTLAPGEREPT